MFFELKNDHLGMKHTSFASHVLITRLSLYLNHLRSIKLKPISQFALQITRLVIISCEY